MLRDIADRIKKRKRWLVDKKPKKPVPTQTQKFCCVNYLWFLCFLIAMVGLGVTYAQLNNTQQQRDHFQNLYLTKPTKHVIIRPRVVKVTEKEIIEKIVEKKVYVRVPVKVRQKSHSGWKHLPERRGAFIR